MEKSKISRKYLIEVFQANQSQIILHLVSFHFHINNDVNYDAELIIINIYSDGSK